MAIQLFADTQIRLAPRVLKTIEQLCESDKKYYAKKLSYPELLDAEGILGVPKRLRLVRLQFSGTRRAVGRYLSNNLCLIAIGIKNQVEHFQAYRTCEIGINDCVPLLESPLAPFLASADKDSSLDDLRQEFVASISDLKTQFATRESLDETFTLVTESYGDHQSEFNRFREQAMREIQRLRKELKHVQETLEVPSPTVWGQLKTLVLG